MKDDALYMFPILPSSQLTGIIDNVRRDFANRFHFYKALKPPVHITLNTPFLVPRELSAYFENKIENLRYWSQQWRSFHIDIQNYNFFNNPQHPVVYLDVIKSDTLLYFHQALIDELTRYGIKNDKSRSFNPHITIGYRDVTPGALPQIRAYYTNRQFSGSFLCDKFHLWKHNGANWQIVKTFPLRDPGTTHAHIY